MNTHHCTCYECERRHQQYADEAFADMVVLAQWHPEWFIFGEDHHGHHDHGALDDDLHDGGGCDVELMDDLDDFGAWD